MAVEPQEYEDDPIIAALGITQAVRPVIPPIDVVYGHYQKTPPNFRLYLETFTMYMECPLGRLLLKGKGSRNRSQLVLNAEGHYEEDVTIGYTSLAPQEDWGTAEPTNIALGMGVQVDEALYAMYAYAKTTPWHA